MAGGKELAALEDAKGVLQLVGLTAEPANELASFLELSNVGRAARATHATDANATSSRSHAALLLRLVDDATGKVWGGRRGRRRRERGNRAKKRGAEL